MPPTAAPWGLRTEIAKYLRRNFDLNYDPATEVLSPAAAQRR